MASRKTEVRGLVDRCFLLSIPYFFVFAGAAGTFLFGLLGLVFPQIPAKNDMFLQACHRRVDRDPIIIEKD